LAPFKTSDRPETSIRYAWFVSGVSQFDAAKESVEHVKAAARIAGAMRREVAFSRSATTIASANPIGTESGRVAGRRYGDNVV